METLLLQHNKAGSGPLDKHTFIMEEMGELLEEELVSNCSKQWT